MKTRNKLIHELVKDTDKELSDEELMHQLLNENIAADVVKKREEKLSFGQKAARTKQIRNLYERKTKICMNETSKFV